MYSPHVRWLIQVPRIYDIISKSGKIKNFGEYLHNVFTPVLEASINPKDNPELAKFLEHVSGFDSVDDESKPESHFFSNDTVRLSQLTSQDLFSPILKTGHSVKIRLTPTTSGTCSQIFPS